MKSQVIWPLRFWLLIIFSIPGFPQLNCWSPWLDSWFSWFCIWLLTGWVLHFFMHYQCYARDGEGGLRRAGKGWGFNNLFPKMSKSKSMGVVVVQLMSKSPPLVHNLSKGYNPLSNPCSRSSLQRQNPFSKVCKAVTHWAPSPTGVTTRL